MQSTGSAFPILERQSTLLAEHLTARWAPPRPALDARRHRAPPPRGARSAGARTGARRCAWTSTPTCTSSGVELERGRKRAAAVTADRDRHRRPAARSARRSSPRCAPAGGRSCGLDLEEGEGTIACDVTDDASVAAAVPRAIERLGGRLDALVNNAGLGGPASAGVAPDEHVRRMLDVNLVGAWRVTAAAIDDARRGARAGRLPRLADGVPRPAARRGLRRVQARGDRVRGRAARRVRHARRASPASTRPSSARRSTTARRPPG